MDRIAIVGGARLNGTIPVSGAKNSAIKLIAASLLNAIGLPELITHSAEDYERLSLELARDPEKLAALKGKLAGLRKTSSLFDTERFTRNLENAYAQAYRRYFEGNAPDHIHVRD